MTDRFWQVGISSGTRDDFYATVGGTRATLEGLASSIRATMRGIRETCYRLLYYMSLLGDHFYGYDELPEPLSHALFSDACSLSTHQMAILVEMVRPVIEHCPPKHRPQFVRPMLATLFVQIDRKTSMEWDRIEERNKFASEDDNLADEMRDESILRQLTFTAVMMIVGLLDPKKLSGLQGLDESFLYTDADCNRSIRLEWKFPYGVQRRCQSPPTYGYNAFLHLINTNCTQAHHTLLHARSSRKGYPSMWPGHTGNAFPHPRILL